VFLQILSGLNTAKVRYLVAGGLAVNIYGVERLTGDLDILLDPSIENLGLFWDYLTGAGFRCRVPIERHEFCDSKNWRKWIRQKGAKVITFYDQADPLKQVDVLIASPVPYSKADRGGVSIPLGGEPVRVVGLKDLILMKQKSGRPKDRLDIAALKRLRSKRK
jgi:hypothetical protein